MTQADGGIQLPTCVILKGKEGEEEEKQKEKKKNYYYSKSIPEVAGGFFSGLETEWNFSCWVLNLLVTNDTIIVFPIFFLWE